MKMKIQLLAALAVGLLSPMAANANPLTYEGTLTSGVPVSGEIPGNTCVAGFGGVGCSTLVTDDPSIWDFWSFYGTAGDLVTISLERISAGLDPRVLLYAGLGDDDSGLTFFSTDSDDGLLAFLARNDDFLGCTDFTAPFCNSLILDFELTMTGWFTIIAMDSLNADEGPYSYLLTATGFTGEPPTPEPGILLEQLGTAVTGVGPGKSLANKIELVQTYLAVPDVQSACALLDDFLNQVRAQRGKKLTEEQADMFTSDAEDIIAAIGCD